MSNSTINCIAFDWAVRCFGPEHVYNIPVRALRTVEEAIELAQACDVPEQVMLDLVKIVYARPKGDIHQELGSVMLTLTILCVVIDVDIDAMLKNELCRVLSLPLEHFAQRNREKQDIPKEQA
jgi:NTP pyrophosphatase (non-canonical NTP hydrolase)